VWQGGAVRTTFEFAKALIVVIVMAVAINTLKRLRTLITIQAVSVGVIATVAVWKGHVLSGGRLDGILGGNYSNPNDLALAIVISLPLCLALGFLSTRYLWKAVWALAILIMIYAVFRTGSRGGFLSLVIATAICLWEFSIRGKRRYLLVLVAVACGMFWQSSGAVLIGRLKGTLDPKQDTASAFDSAQQRQLLFWRSIEVTAEHPLFGVGPGNFAEVSGNWHVTHNSFTQVSSEGGLLALVVYLLILSRGFKNVRATKRLTTGKGELSLWAKALRASLFAYVIGSLFASTAYESFPYFLVLYTTALFLIAQESANSKKHKAASQVILEKRIHPDSTNTETLVSYS
jgi:O-antigen ligase